MTPPSLKKLAEEKRDVALWGIQFARPIDLTRCRGEVEAAIIEGMKKALDAVKLSCRCDAGFTSRGLEDPCCQAHDLEDVIESLKQTLGEKE